MKRVAAGLLALLLCLAGCVTGSEEAPAPAPFQPDSPAPPQYQEFEGPTVEEYIQQVVHGVAQTIYQPKMSEYERAKATFDYLIEVGCYRWSPALDLWRIRTTDDSTPDFVQTRAIGFLTHGMGTCEDYASAMVLLLRDMGMEAQYMPGLTYSREGDLVYHAWALAKVDGIWYHFDAELEDGISTEGVVRYKYFMKCDSTMAQSHLWGQQLINSGRLKPDQNEEIAERYLGQPCPQDHPLPEASSIPVTFMPDEDQVLNAYDSERQTFEETYGKREYRELVILPPVFGRYGGYSSNASFAERSGDYIYNILTARLLIRPEQEGSLPG